MMCSWFYLTPPLYTTLHYVWLIVDVDFPSAHVPVGLFGFIFMRGLFPLEFVLSVSACLS